MGHDSRDAYADRVVITFNQVEGMSGSKVLDSYEVTIDPNGCIDLDWLNTEIESIFLQEPDPDTGIRYQRDSFVLRQSRTHVSWGADAATVQFFVETAAYIGQQGGAALVGAGVLKLVQMLKDRGYHVVAGKPEKLTDEEASRFGLQLIEREYDVDLPALTLSSIGLNEYSQYVCTAAGADGSYTVTFVVQGADTKLISRSHSLD